MTIILTNLNKSDDEIYLLGKNQIKIFLSQYEKKKIK